MGKCQQVDFSVDKHGFTQSLPNGRYKMRCRQNTWKQQHILLVSAATELLLPWI